MPLHVAFDGQAVHVPFTLYWLDVHVVVVVVVVVVAAPVVLVVVVVVAVDEPQVTTPLLTIIFPSLHVASIPLHVAFAGHAVHTPFTRY